MGGVERRARNSLVGIDVGLKEFAVTSEAEIIPNPKFLRKSEKRLKRIQRNHSRKKKGSANRERSRIKLAKAHRKVARQRKDFIKQSAASIAKKHDAVFVEDLNVKGMVRNHHLAKSIADVGWGMFIRELEWQCQKRSKHFAKIDSWHPSSKTCSACGWKNTELSLSDRVFVCRNCDTEIDRDLNAAFNILKQGTLILENRVGTTRIEACGEVVRHQEDVGPDAALMKQEAAKTLVLQ